MDEHDESPKTTSTAGLTLVPTGGKIFDGSGRAYYDTASRLELRRAWNASTMTEEEQLLADAIYLADQVHCYSTICTDQARRTCLTCSASRNAPRPP